MLDGVQAPEELARREKRLAEIARAKAVIEARARARVTPLIYGRSHRLHRHAHATSNGLVH